MASAIAVRSASAVGSQIAGKLAGKLAVLVREEATLLWKFKDDVDRLKETMEFVNALMHDADARQASHQDQGERVRVLWMKKFKSVAYDVEDLLDKFEAIQHLQQNQSKIRLFFSSYNPLLLRFTIAHKMKKVKQDLANIEKEGRETLGLIPPVTPMWADVVATNRATIASTTWETNNIMVGRDTEKEKIMELLKSEAEEVISIIPIIGLGGMGKTTLAQAIFSDNRTITLFDVRVWIYVSEKFDLQRIGDIILSTVRRSTNNEPSERYIQPKEGDLQSIVEILKMMLHNKKYLIVLDDMWEEGFDNLEKLKQMLQNGGKGSKIILTTRMQQVVDKLDVGTALTDQGIIRPLCNSDQINLSILSDDDCWNVMQQIAFKRQDEGLGGLEAIGRDIAKNCAVFPKGFTIASDHLIQQWRSLGYI
ncbi:unnamed protein product [Urochloa humidicola]